MIREIYMVSILQLQKKKKSFNLPRNWQPLDVFSILYVMFRCSLERIGCYEWKETFASHQQHEFRLKAAVQDFYEESGPGAILVLVNEAAWATCPPPPCLLHPPAGAITISFATETGESTVCSWNEHDPERHSVRSMRSLERSQLCFPSCCFHSCFLNQLVNQWRGSPCGSFTW